MVSVNPKKKIPVSELYSRRAPDYGKRGESNLLDFEESEIENFFPDLKGKTVLDVGCGTGRWTGRFVEAGAEVTGIDSSSEMIEVALKRVDATFLEGSALELPFKKNSFDFVFSSLMLSHLKDWEKALLEMKRVAKEGGVFGFSDVHGVFEREGDVVPFETDGGEVWVDSFRIFPSQAYEVCGGCDIVEFREIIPGREFQKSARFSKPGEPLILFMLFRK